MLLKYNSIFERRKIGLWHVSKQKNIEIVACISLFSCLYKWSEYFSDFLKTMTTSTSICLIEDFSNIFAFPWHKGPYKPNSSNKPIYFNGIWRGGTTSLVVINLVKKRQMQSIWFLQVSKFSWTTFETIFETLSALGACHVTFIERVVYERSMIFEGFLRISRRVFDISSWNLFW